MSTNYGRVDGPEGGDRTAASSSNGNPTEPVADSHPTEPIRGANPTKPIRGADPTEPIHGANPTKPIHDARRTEPIHDARRTEPDRPEGRSALPNAEPRTPVPAGATAGRRRRPRAGTIVWGLVVTALAVVLILAEARTLNLDMGQVVIGLLIGAGLALVIGGVVSAGNREKDDKHP